MISQGKTTLLNRRRLAGVGLVASTRHLLRLWLVRHRGRQNLAKLDDHMLRDIGLDRPEAQREISRRFWQK